MLHQTGQFKRSNACEAQFVAASNACIDLLTSQDPMNHGDAVMTASAQNTNSSFRILQKTLREECGLSPEEKLWHLEHLIDSFQKCIASLSAQVRFYESAKHTGRALIVENDDGSHEVVSGQQVQALRLPLPNLQEDAVIFGSESALKAVAVALSHMNWPSDGPAKLTDLAKHLAEKASPPDREMRSHDQSDHSTDLSETERGTSHPH